MDPFILAFLSTLAITIIILIIKLIYSTLWVPYKIQRQFQKQGIRGPGYRPISGNAPEFKRGFEAKYNNPMPYFSHDIVHRVDPSCQEWRAMYGKTMLFWHGCVPMLALADPRMLQEIFLNKSNRVGKVKPQPLVKKLFGHGLITLKGEELSRHRKIINPAFTTDQVKSWIPEIVSSVQMILKKWENEIGLAETKEVEVDVLKELHFLTGEILSKTAFGSNFEEGKRIFELQDQQATLAMEALRTVYIPGSRFFPTPNNITGWRLENETRRQISMIIDKYDKKGGINNPNCLLSFLLGGGLSIDEMSEECQTFYFTGKETVVKFLCWTLLLLALHQEWQSKAREEVFEASKNRGIPNIDVINDLKIVTMVLNEALRLYPPVPFLFREASQDMKVGNLDVPAGTQFFLRVIAVHHDPEIWGADANEFNPLRFSEPRKHMGSFLPFGLGSRMCIAQNFSIMEGKLILSMILKQFSFRLSPSYVHAPVTHLTITPEYGAQIIFRKI